MPVQQTIDTADAVVSLINAAAIGVTFSRVFVPEFEVDDLPAPKGIVVPSGLTVEAASRTTDYDDHTIEIGLGRRLEDEAVDTAAHLLTFEAVLSVIRGTRQLTTADGDVVTLKGAVEVRLYDPEHVRKRIVLSVIRATYRGQI